MSEIALEGATIFTDPAEHPIRNGVVLISGVNIAAAGPQADVQVPPRAQRIDCSGLTVTAGFWNSHIHFFERKWANAATIPASELTRQLEEMLTRYGFTSVFDLSSMWENTRRLRDRIESGEVSGPRIRSTGEGLLPPAAMPPDIVFEMMGTMKTPMNETADAEQAAAISRRLLEDGVDGIKLFVSYPRGAPLAEGTIEAAAAEAHGAGKPVFVHPNTGEQVLRALRAGVDVIAHTTPHSGPWDETILAEIEQRPRALTPTLTIWKHYMRHDRISAQDRLVETELGQLRAWISAGGTVLFGNDLGAVDYDPAEEYSLMAQAGMSFRQILASLTTVPAAQFGASNRLGRIVPGLAADLVVLKGDPAKDISALTAVQYTLRDGRIIYRSR